MILVLLGTQNNSFHRLLEKIEKMIEEGKIQEEVIAQAGYTKFESEKMKVFDFIPTEEMDKLQERADIIITHGGVGSITSCLKKGKKIIAIPRLHEYEEHVNDHQKEIIQIFDEKGYIVGCQNVEDLDNAIEKIREFKPKKYESHTTNIINIITDFIENDTKK